jgi:hypothetical protein
MCKVKQRPNHVEDGATLCRRAGSSHTGSEHIWGRGRRSAKCSPPNVFVPAKVTMTSTRPRCAVMIQARIVALVFASLALPRPHYLPKVFSLRGLRPHPSMADSAETSLVESKSKVGGKRPAQPEESEGVISGAESGS